MKVLALTDCLIGYHTFWIRVGQYLKQISKDLDITIAYDSNLIRNLQKGDKLIFYRYSLEWGDLSIELEKAKSRGVYIISDVDDYLWNDGELRGWNKQRLKLYTRALKSCNLITCSTLRLKDQLSVMFGNIELQIFKNTAPPNCTAKSNSHSGKVRIGWTGAPWTRPYDLQEIKLLVEWLCHNKQNIELVHIGHSDKFMSFADILNINSSYVKTIPISDYETYTSNLHIDIGLAPLKESCFNSFKSPIKVIEYSANGIPWISSNASVYRDLCKDWSWKGRLCNNSDEWIENVKELLCDNKRYKEGESLKSKCEKYSPNSHGVENWRRVLT